MTYDSINPSHYKGNRKYEPIDVIEDWELNYRLGNALKYISRNGRKPDEDPREGLKKAVWYLEREIASLDSPAPYAPPSDVQYDDVPEASAAGYEDVLKYYGQTQDEKEAWPEVPFSADCEDWEDLWDPTDSEHDLYVTDTSAFLEPRAQLSDVEVSALLDKKDLNQFGVDEIVTTVEKRGFILGIKKDGTTCELGRNGRCV